MVIKRFLDLQPRGGDNRSSSGMAKCSAGVNSDLGECFFLRYVQAGTKHADRCAR